VPFGAAGVAEPGGIALLILSRSFAVRALLGSLVAAALVVLASRLHLVQGRNTRRLLVLAPVLTAAATTVGSVGYLPELWITGSGDGGSVRMIEVVGFLDYARQLGLLASVYAICVIVLLSRRTLGTLAVRGLLRSGRAPASDSRLATAVRDGAARMGVRPPRVLEVPACPGGAFATGVVRPVVGVDAALVAALDDRELEGLVAHELAHLRRRDPLMWVLVGVFRDATFFLGPISLAMRWLHREQEESADEAAAVATRRPAALASSILKVWERREGAARVRVACAAVPVRAAGLLRGPRSPADDIAQRVERLIAGPQVLPRWRNAAEALLATTVIAAATVTATTLPELVGNGDLYVYYGRRAPAVEEPRSPAFSTFHALTAVPADDLKPPIKDGGDGVEVATCPCVESQAQLRQARPATAAPPDPRLRWGSGRDRVGIRDYEDANAIWLFRGDGTGIWYQERAERPVVP